MKKPVTDYRKLRLSNLNSPEFRHVKLLLYWPVYGLLFLFVERFYQPGAYYSMHCALDDLIPFSELFLLPYLFWFVFLTGMLVYTFFYDTECFSRMMKFIIITYTAALLVYFIFPNCQQLRPKSFERDNILTRFMAWFYRFDTDTNGRPEHPCLSLQGLETGLHADGGPDLCVHRVCQAALGAGYSRGAAPVRHRLSYIL